MYAVNISARYGQKTCTFHTCFLESLGEPNQSKQDVLSHGNMSGTTAYLLN